MIRQAMRAAILSVAASGVIALLAAPFPQNKQ